MNRRDTVDPSKHAQKQRCQTMADPSEDGRHMNDTTMPPPRTKTGQVAAKPDSKKKVGLKKGFGLSDWSRLLSSSKDLAQRKGADLRRIKWDEIKKHKTKYDGWTVLHGKVYFISPYLAYHPGGDSILEAILGKDCSKLYLKYHNWVNEDGLIAKLHIGYLDRTPRRDAAEKRSYLPPQIMNDGFAMPAPRPPKAVVSAAVLVTKPEEEDSDEEDLNPWERPNPK